MKRQESLLEVNGALGAHLEDLRRAESSDIGNQTITEASPSGDLQQIYRTRFSAQRSYRQRVWEVLCPFFTRWISPGATVLDLGCGWCEFINTIQCQAKFAMDLNPDSQLYARPEVTLLRQDCSETWRLGDGTLHVVFSSNFFEHLPTKVALEKTVVEAHRTLKPGGRLICMGPNIKYVPGAYWDFIDHHLPLTERSLVELMEKCGFEVEYCLDRFLPYTMAQGPRYPVRMLGAYLSFPLAWRLFGKQFLVVARKKTRQAPISITND
jgi:SAM-dependent methyltransferase